MLKWITCYLSGKHDFQVACEPGAIYLRCNHCGRRSNGWALQHEPTLQAVQVSVAPPPRASITAVRAALR